MRHVVTGNDAAGRSCVVRELSIDRRARNALWESAAGDVTAFGFDAAEQSIGNFPPPGHTKWYSQWIPPNYDRVFHWSESIDFGIALEGRIDLLLDAGTVTFGAGDSWVLPGVRHGWRTGEEGCFRMILSLGATKPRAAGGDRGAAGE